MAVLTGEKFKGGELKAVLVSVREMSIEFFFFFSTRGDSCQVQIIFLYASSCEDCDANVGDPIARFKSNLVRIEFEHCLLLLYYSI